MEILLREQGGAESKIARQATARNVENCVAVGFGRGVRGWGGMDSEESHDRAERGVPCQALIQNKCQSMADVPGKAELHRYFHQRCCCDAQTKPAESQDKTIC